MNLKYLFVVRWLLLNLYVEPINETIMVIKMKKSLKWLELSDDGDKVTKDLIT